MATFEDVKRLISTQTAQIRERVPQIIAETATEYFKQRFTDKEWEGEPWPETKRPNPRGSLMIRSGALVSTIRPSLVTASEVRISAGGPRVPYAQIHNEGGIINHPGGTPWTMIKEGDVLQPVWVSKKRTQQTGRKYPVTKPHPIPMPKRQFMGDSARLNDLMIERINNYINSLNT